MSWEAYVSQNLMMPVDTNGSTLKSAALLGLDGSVWAKSDAFPEFKDDEWAKLLDAMTNNAATSVFIAGFKYMKTFGDETVLRARKDKFGFTARKTNQAVVIGFYEDPPVSGQTCNKVVDALADYLENQGY